MKTELESLAGLLANEYAPLELKWEILKAEKDGGRWSLVVRRVDEGAKNESDEQA